jgi:hypothetical protein
VERRRRHLREMLAYDGVVQHLHGGDAELRTLSVTALHRRWIEARTALEAVWTEMGSLVPGEEELTEKGRHLTACEESLQQTVDGLLDELKTRGERAGLFAPITRPYLAALPA